MTEPRVQSPALKLALTCGLDLWLPAAALLGVVLPITFLQRLQSYSHHLDALELLGAYATTTLMVLPAALVLTALVLISRPFAAWMPWLPGGRWQNWSEGAFALLMAGGLYFGLRHWWMSLNLHPEWQLPRAAWAPIVMLVLFTASARVRTALRVWHAPARWASAMGVCTLACLPFMGWPDRAPAAGSASSGRPHLVLLTFDALSASRMSIYGAQRPTTPELEAWAAGGVVMERFYSGSNYTTSALNTLLTGRYVHEHGALQLLSAPTPEARSQSLPAVLKGAGYRTLAVSTNPLGGPLKNGFGAYFDAVASDQINTYFSGRDGPSRHLRFMSVALDNPLVDGLWQPARTARFRYAEAQSQNRHFDPARPYEAARRLLAEPRPAQQPVFLWVHVLPPHSPYAAPAPYLGMFDPSPALRDMESSTPPFMFAYGRLEEPEKRTFEARYDESVRFLDSGIEGFMRMIEQSLGPRTVVMVSADHGESFSHGYGGHAGPLLSEPVIRIPLVVRGDGVASGKRLQTIAGHVDLAATLAELAGAKVPPSWRGRSLAADWRAGEDRPDGEALVVNLEQSARQDPLRQGTAALVTKQWKLVQVLGEPRYPGEPALRGAQLFSLEQDPAESHNLAHAYPQVLAQMRRRLAAGLGLPESAPQLRDSGFPSNPAQ